LTTQQSLAVTTRDVSIGLSAGAGCGKTHVLVERYLSHLAPGQANNAASTSDLAALIAITFTDRAAREMRDRVRRKCRERLHAAEEREADAWLTLLRELETARVSTIHAFCGSLLRAHAVEAGLDPRFVILQPGQSATLFAEQIDGQLRLLLGNRNEELLELAVMFGLAPLREMVQRLLGRRHAIDFAQWRNISSDDLVERWQQIERTRVVPQLRAEFLQLPETLALRKIISHWAPAHARLIERFTDLREHFAALDAGAELLPALATIRAAATVQYVGEKHWFSPEVYQEFRDSATELRQWIDNRLKCLGVTRQSSVASAAAGLALLRLAEPIITAYEDRKRELGMLDFDDLLRRARDLLTGPHGASLRQRLSSQLVLLLVDEFQDTDPLQVELVKILCGDQLYAGKLFFVGDAKQSIYRFRHADPRVFRDLQAEIPAAGRMPLTLNFRSQPGVLEFVNALFCDRLGPHYEALEASRPRISQTPTIEFLWATMSGDNTEKFNVEAARQQEADWIARRISGLLATGEVQVQDKKTGEHRGVAPGDIAILFRALPDVRFYEEALRRYEIPYYLVGGGAFYAQQEIFDLLNLLRSLDRPGDEVSLAGVLRSPFFSLTDESLFWLAQYPGGLSAGLFGRQPLGELTDAQRARVRFAAETLTFLRSRKDRLPIAGLIREALARTGYDALLVAEFLGERKLANLRKLIDQARSFDEAGIFTLSDFIHELAEFIARQPDEPPAPVELESSTVVRLMTIHQAKGLEFPVVVVPDLDRAKRGHHVAVAFDSELGPLVRARHHDNDDRPCGLDLYRLLEAQEEADEGIRLLYVATTRAADYLILSAGVKDLDQPSSSWLELLAERFDLRTGELLATLPAGYARPHVRTTLEQPAAPRATGPNAARLDWSKQIAELLEQANGSAVRPSRLVESIPADQTARKIFSFSRLAGSFDIVPWDVPEGENLTRLEADAGSDATELGVLTHEVLARIDFAQPGDIEQKCRHELARRFSSATVEPATASGLINRFLRSRRADALRNAAKVHRELEFLLRWPPDRAGEGPLIQGFIDCLYQDTARDWHVLDYKTNRVTADGVPRLAAQYELQMMLYALAVEQVMGVAPASLVLCFLQPGVEHVVPWNAAARAHVLAQVNRALAAMLHTAPSRAQTESKQN